jgi:hypothetical protein
VKVFAYANNHYSGHAPDSVEQFRKLWKVMAGDEIGKPKPAVVPSSIRQSSFLFE